MAEEAKYEKQIELERKRQRYENEMMRIEDEIANEIRRRDARREAFKKAAAFLGEQLKIDPNNVVTAESQMNSLFQKQRKKEQERKDAIDEAERLKEKEKELDEKQRKINELKRQHLEMQQRKQEVELRLLQATSGAAAGAGGPVGPMVGAGGGAGGGAGIPYRIILPKGRIPNAKNASKPENLRYDPTKKGVSIDFQKKQLSAELLELRENYQTFLSLLDEKSLLDTMKKIWEENMHEFSTTIVKHSPGTVSQKQLEILPDNIRNATRMIGGSRQSGGIGYETPDTLPSSPIDDIRYKPKPPRNLLELENARKLATEMDKTFFNNFLKAIKNILSGTSDILNTIILLVTVQSLIMSFENVTRSGASAQFFQLSLNSTGMMSIVLLFTILAQMLKKLKSNSAKTKQELERAFSTSNKKSSIFNFSTNMDIFDTIIILVLFVWFVLLSSFFLKSRFGVESNPVSEELVNVIKENEGVYELIPIPLPRQILLPTQIVKSIGESLHRISHRSVYEFKICPSHLSNVCTAVFGNRTTSAEQEEATRSYLTEAIIYPITNIVRHTGNSVGFLWSFARAMAL